MSDEAFRLQLRLRIRADIDKVGFSRVGVGPFPNERGHGKPFNFAYSVGLSYTSFSCSDVIIFGPYQLPLLMDIVWDAARSMLLAGVHYEAGRSQAVTAEGRVYPFPFFFAEVEQRYFHEYPKAAVDFYSTPSFPLLQMVWPDTHGRWPWNPGFEEQFSGTQPLLFPIKAVPPPLK